MPAQGSKSPLGRNSFALTPAPQVDNLEAMRFAMTTVCLISLWALLVHAWNHQFEPTPGSSTLHLQDLPLLRSTASPIQPNANSLTLSAIDGARHATFDLPLPSHGESLHVRISASTKQLIPGKEIWQDGRIFLEWLTPDNQRAKITPLHSAQYDSHASLSFAVKVPRGDLRPVLHLQHLGHQGDFVIHGIELSPAQHTRLWKWSSPLITLASVGLIASLLFHPSRASLPRCLGAAGITVLFAYFFILPGPWPKRVGIRQALHWVEPTSPNHAPTTPQASPENKTETARKAIASTPAHAAEYGELPEPDNLVLRAKKTLKKIRPLLHVALFLIPVLLISFCVGAKRAFGLGMTMSLGVEAAQWLFGYGFQAEDIRDLLSNLCGISLAIFCYRRLGRKDLPSCFLQP